jgi:hypothetical protein
MKFSDASYNASHFPYLSRVQQVPYFSSVATPAHDHPLSQNFSDL